MVEQLHGSQLAGFFARFGRPVAIVDLETTGGHLYEDRITEIAILRAPHPARSAGLPSAAAAGLTVFSAV